MKRIFCYVFVLFFSFFVVTPRIYAQACDSSNLSNLNLDELIAREAKCKEAFNQMEVAKKPHVDSLKRMESDIEAFKNRIISIEKELIKKDAAIKVGEKEFDEQLKLTGQRIRSFYMRTSGRSPMATLLSASDVGVAFRILGYESAIVTEDKKIITQTVLLLKDLEERKAKLESERATLSKLKTDLDSRAASVKKLVDEASAYQTKLTGIIASLSAQQQAILNARSGTFTTNVGDVPLADDPNSSPTYNPGFSPAFGAFSFGAYTHRKGMSQYGAKGRAMSGQNVNDILKAYYGKTPVGKDTGGDIQIQGVGSKNFEDYYLMGIAEMPASFPKEALKAQAIAARTYAWRYKTSGQSICTTQSCQVFLSSKADNPPSEWRQAVQETKGQIIEDVVTYYSSTTGGYGSPGGWDTKCGNQGCWTGDAYEKIASSPWFYKGWYTENYYNNSGKCGKSHPWLTQEEFSDILNAWIVLKNGSSDDAKRILPVTVNTCGFPGASGDPYSMGQLREKADGLGGGVTSVSSVSVSYNSGGYTDTVTLQTNKGELKISGAEFVKAFNLRAPGYISIRGVVNGSQALFNIEKK